MNLTGIKTRTETTNVRAMVEFYTQIIGLTVLQNWGDQSGAILGFDINSNGFLEIAFAKEPKRTADLTLQFRVDSITDFLKRIDGIWEHSDATPRPWGSTYVYLQDPDGTQLIVYEGVI
ncbi:MAG: VOC family protein [Calditrichia bacterium]